ncbi:hypothetical protein Acsp04_51750 [Actinomadura sp. NBRC 104425]|nr:hypothetical protein Acsp04_51750 [Actinomadura sp. NBRC 104425]
MCVLGVIAVNGVVGGPGTDKQRSFLDFTFAGLRVLCLISYGPWYSAVRAPFCAPVGGAPNPMAPVAWEPGTQQFFGVNPRAAAVGPLLGPNPSANPVGSQGEERT